jgi:CubicO group peptidase (beta-lactamase class C family)
MMWRFARRQDSRPSTASRAADRPGRRAGRMRPEAEALDSRLLMASGHLSAAAATASHKLADRVEQALTPYFDQDKFPGISVAIVKDGHIALARGFGVSDVAAGTPTRADTRFGIGSVTKTFTAIGVLLLYQESQGTAHPLNLDAPIGQYLHDNRSFKLPRAWSHITTRELLDMTSGIRDVGGSRPWQAQLASIANDPLLYTPGKKTSYSNANYDLLGELIEQWTGESYGTFIQNQVLAPLGMSGTQVLGRSAMVSDQAVGYGASRHGKWSKIKVQNGAAMYAAAGMVSTAHDMARYMAALLDDRLLTPATYAMMWTATPTPQYGVRPAHNGVRGLGWDTAIDTSTGPAEVAKSGEVPGYTTELILYPSSDSGVFVSINTSNQNGRNPSNVTAYEVAESVYQAAQVAQ